MGWLSLRSRQPQEVSPPSTSEPTEIANGKLSIENVEHIEYTDLTQIENSQHPGNKYPLQDCTTPDDSLPFISPSEVRAQRARQGQGRAWIVVENIVYDCTDFMKKHPGGDTFIRSFVGEECSWQFWRFHPKDVMDLWGQPLRVGRTRGIENRFSEPPRFFGSRMSHKLH